MNFEFIPFRLNADLRDYKDLLDYISTENGIDIYKARDELPTQIPGVTVSKANLYFYQCSLVTVYIYLVHHSNGLLPVLAKIENLIQKNGYKFDVQSKQVYGWANEGEFLALILVEETNSMCLYYSLETYSCL